MTFNPKLLALDVDGTLVDHENQMSEAVREAVLAHHARGAHIVVSTGRSVPGTSETVGKLGLDDGYAVASNGAVVFGYDPVDVVHTVTFDASDAVHRVLDHVPDAMVAVEEVGVGYRVTEPFPDGEVLGTMVVDEVASLVAEPVTRVIIRAPAYDTGEFADLVSGLGLTGTNYYIGYTSWLDLAPLDVSKASGLGWLCERLGVERSDVLAIGDGNNDYEMLAWAGRGVAMGAAPQRVRDVADFVTDSVTKDGLARELERWL